MGVERGTSGSSIKNMATAQPNLVDLGKGFILYAAKGFFYAGMEILNFLQGDGLSN